MRGFGISSVWGSVDLKVTVLIRIVRIEVKVKTVINNRINIKTSKINFNTKCINMPSRGLVVLSMGVM